MLFLTGKSASCFDGCATQTFSGSTDHLYVRSTEVNFMKEFSRTRRLFLSACGSCQVSYRGAFIGFHGEGLKRVTQAGRLPQTPVHCVSGDRFWFSAMRTIQQVNCMSASNCYLDPTVMLKSLL